MRKHWLYLKYVMRHKWYVFVEGRKHQLPLLRLLLHDWDKFLPGEWFPYVERFYGGNDFQAALSNPEYQMAWHMHQKRNKHHWQWWVTPREDGTFRILPMDITSAYEMAIDLKAMSRQHGTDAREWYHSHRDIMHLHPESRRYIEHVLKYLPEMSAMEAVEVS